jgi:hypothetical protein
VSENSNPGDPVNCIACGVTLAYANDGVVRGGPLLGPITLTSEGARCFDEIECHQRVRYRAEERARREAELRPRPVTLYAAGLVHASVCTSRSDAETLAYVDDIHPTGLERGWAISDDPAFADGKPNPSPCEHYPETHRHVLLVC